MTFPTLSFFWQATIPLIRQNGHVEAVRFFRPQFAEGFGPRMRAPNQALPPTRAQALRARGAGESSPGVFRAFCGCCGSPIYSRRPDAPDVLRLRLGILNDDPRRRSLAHFWVGSKAAWFDIADDLPQFAGGPAEHEQELATIIKVR